MFGLPAGLEKLPVRHGRTAPTFPHLVLAGNRHRAEPWDIVAAVPLPHLRLWRPPGRGWDVGKRAVWAQHAAALTCRAEATGRSDNDS